MTYQDDVTVVRRALLRRFREGADVGQFLIAAIVAAEHQLQTAPEFDGMFLSLADNRPGLWEGTSLAVLMDWAGGGAERPGGRAGPTA